MASTKRVFGLASSIYVCLLPAAIVACIVVTALVVWRPFRGAPADESSESPLDLLKRICEPHLANDDPYAFAMKIRGMMQGWHDMWGGGKELFYEWCKAHTAGLLADRQAWVPQHGDYHVGNLGTYLAAGSLGNIAFGLVDYDESHRLPVQLELLQIVIGLRIAAEKHKVVLDRVRQRELVRCLFDNYIVGLTADRPPTQVLANDPLVKDLLRKAARIPYHEGLSQYTDGKGRFHRLIPPGETREPAELLRPAMDMADQLAAGIAQAIARSENMAKLFRVRTEGEIRSAIRDVARRINLRSTGSQGTRKYLILMEKPFASFDHDVILYAKQQIPSAAERAGLAEMDGRPPGRRCAEDSFALAAPPPFMAAWFQLGRDSYTLLVKEPWTRELDRDDAWDNDSLLRLARISGVCAGSTHRQDGQAAMIRSRLTPALADKLLRLSDSFLAKLRADSERLRSDPRAETLAWAAKRAIAAHINETVR